MPIAGRGLRVRANNNVRRLIADGRSDRQIAKQLGLSVVEVAEVRGRPLRANALDGSLASAFLAAHTRASRQDRTQLINGQQLTASETRAIHRWSAEAASPSFWALDRILTSVGLHLDAFFDYCERQGRSPWARGRPPKWLE